MIARRKMICGMHVHVDVPEGVSRVDLMVRMLPFVPLILALSTSSPFWHSHRTGLMGYRQALYAELPRSGLPDLFRDEADYEAYLGALSRIASSPMRAISGGRCGPRRSIRRSS